MNLLFSNDKRGRYPDSWYAATATPLPPCPPLKGETRADVCIVGGGFTGLSAALELAQRGVDVVLLEAHRVGFGASGRNGGQVGSGQRLGQEALEKMQGRDHARQLWDLGEAAKTRVKDLIAAHGIDAKWRDGVAHADLSPGDVAETHAEADHLAEVYGYEKIEKLDRDGIRALVGSERFHGGSVDWGAGHIHPLRFAIGLAEAAQKAGAHLHEMSHVHHLKPGAKVLVQTDKGRVLADHVILAGNGYLGGLERKVTARVMPINNFIVATEPLGDRAASVLAKDIAVADSKFVVNYWRLSEDQRLLFGGGESYGYRFPKDIRALVRKPMLDIYPHLADVQLDYAWGGTLAITMNRLPYFAQAAPNILSASGYSGHGVALATLAGQILAEATRGQMERFDIMSSLPMPRFPGGPMLRSPLLAIAMTWYTLRDKLGM